MQRGLALFGVLLGTTVQAQDNTYRYGYLSHVEGEVSLQRASEPEPESGSLNVPILPGDRIWTRADSRAEIRFGSGVVVRLSEGAKLDFVAMDSETILRLWSGSAIVKIVEAPGPLRIDSPAGSVRPTREGSYRIDVESGDAVTLSVERGSAELAGPKGSVLVQSGETSFAAPSEPPSIPVKYNTASLDDFDRWSESRDSRTSRTQDIVVRSLPHAVRSYAYDLTDYGDWYPEPDYGYVWYPRVEVGWAPYTYGRWGYTTFGHTWISSEPWGWAPYHYGRWGFGHRGWYWIPGAVWGPAWVSFAIGPTWVGWSPLGYYGGPVFAFNTYFGGYGYGYGYGYPYGGHHGHHRGGWNVCSRDDFRSGVVTRAGYRRLEPEDLGSSRSSVRFVDEVTSLDRDLDSRVAGLRTAVSRSDRRIEETSTRPAVRARSEEALRGFRERASLPSARVVNDSARTTSRRDQRPDDVSEIVRRAREIRGASESTGRERTPAGRIESRSPMRDSSPREERGERAEPESRAFRREGARGRSFVTEPVSPPESIDRRERFERARERVMPLMPSRETPSTRSTSREMPRTSRSSRELSPRGSAPEGSAAPRTRVERAAPRTREAPSRDVGGGGGPSFRERSSSVGRSSTNPGGSRSSGQRSGSSPSSRGSARTRSK